MSVETVGTSEIFRNIIALSILAPIVWFLLKQQDRRMDDFNSSIRDGFDELSKSFKYGVHEIKETFAKHEKGDIEAMEMVNNTIEKFRRSSDKNYISTIKSLGNTILSKEQTIDIFKAKMWLVSHGKLEYLRSVILGNHFRGREEQIRTNIRAELERQSLTYMNDFSGYSTPVGLLSDWLRESFTEEQFNKFVKDVGDIVLSDSYSELEKTAACELKLKDVATRMKTLQNQLAVKLNNDCENYE